MWLYTVHDMKEVKIGEQRSERRRPVSSGRVIEKIEM